MIKIISFILFMLGNFSGFCQNSIFVGTKSYPATKTWSFLKNGKYASYQFDATLEVTFAKAKPDGYMMLSAGGVFFADQSIGGPVLIYLSNGEVLTLNNRIYKDFADEKSTVIYSVESGQIEKLKQFNISKIRYSIIASYSTKGYTAENRYNRSYEPGVYDEGEYQTAYELGKFF